MSPPSPPAQPIRPPTALRRPSGRSLHDVLPIDALGQLPRAAVFLVDPDLRYAAAGGEGLVRVGMEASALVGRALDAAWPEGLGAELAACCARAFNGHAFELGQTLQGRRLLSRGTLLPGHAGRPPQVLVMCLDVTDRGPDGRRPRPSQAVLLRLGEVLRDAHTPPEVLRVAAREAGHALDTVAAVIVEGSLDGAGLIAPAPPWHVPGLPAGVVEAAVGAWGDRALRTVRSGHAFRLEDMAHDVLPAPGTQAPPLQAALAVPMPREGMANGLLFVFADAPRAWSECDVETLWKIGEHAGAALERALAGVQLRESEQRFSAIVHQTAAGIARVDFDGRLTFANATLADMLGYSAAELVGMPLRAITVAEDVDPRMRMFKQLAIDGTPLHIEKRLVRRDGSHICASVSASAIRDDAGAPQSAVAVVIDITERQRAEAASRENERRLRVALEAADMGTWLWRVDVDKQQVDANLMRLMGFGEHDAAMTLEDFLNGIHAEDRDRVLDAFARAVATRGDLDVEFRVMRPDGGVRWLKDQGKTFLRDDGRVDFLTGACMDITARRQMEESLLETDRRKDEFLATLAHELRNPLAPIRNGLRLLGVEGADAATVASVRDMMERQVHHMVRLVDDLLELSRITRGRIDLRREVVTLDAVLQAALEASQPLIEAAGHRLVVQPDSGPVALHGDPIRLTQIFSNILNNAARYTDPGGSIRVRTWMRDASTVQVDIEDTGIGLSAAQLPRIFEMFVRGDASRDPNGGLGIGLTLVRSVAQLHGGSVEARSAGPGRGSVFSVVLPVAPPHPAQAPAPALVAMHAGLRVLLVDDNRDAADSLGVLLELDDVRTCVVYDGHVALRMLDVFPADVALLDLGMPGMDGCELARGIRAHPRGAGITLVALTGWGQARDRERTRAAGFDHHLVKPVDYDALVALLSRDRTP